MSNVAVALEAAPSTVDFEAGGASGVMTALKDRLLKFLNRLPEHYDDVDPINFRRLPVPY